jgi:hypothetical protein
MTYGKLNVIDLGHRRESVFMKRRITKSDYIALERAQDEGWFMTELGDYEIVEDEVGSSERERDRLALNDVDLTRHGISNLR